MYYQLLPSLWETRIDDLMVHVEENVIPIWNRVFPQSLSLFLSLFLIQFTV